VNVLPIIERRVRHGTKFNVMLAQVQPGVSKAPPGATTQLDGGDHGHRACAFSANKTA